MFLKELFLFSRTLFISFLAFIFLFIFLNIKWGIVAFPVNEYGMYSGKLYTSDTQQVYLVYANDTLIDFSRLSMTQRDMLQYSLDYYLNEKENNAAVYSNMKRVLTKLFIGKLMRVENYTNKLGPVTFNKWFTNKLSDITGMQIFRLAAYSCNYCWQSGRLKPVSEPIKLTGVEFDQ